MKTLSALLLTLLLASPIFAQGVLVPTFDDLAEIQEYDDTELRQRIEAIEIAIQKLAEAISPPENPGEPPVDPPKPPVEPVDPPTPGEYPSYEAALQHPSLLSAFHFRDQAEINRRSVNAKKGVDPVNNENVIYDPEMDAAMLRYEHSIALTNRVQVGFGKTVTTGHLVWVWDVRPNEDWRDHNTTVHTHKMFMAISANDLKDRRSMEQRFHYFRSPGGWEVDMRPYSTGGSLKGEGWGLDRLTPWNKSIVRVGEWVRFYSEVDFTGDFPVYTLRFKQGDEISTPYDRAPVNNLVTRKGGLTGFDPTWAITSQDDPVERERVHIHLRNVYVLHSPEVIDMGPIIAAGVE